MYMVKDMSKKRIIINALLVIVLIGGLIWFLHDSLNKKNARADYNKFFEEAFRVSYVDHGKGLGDIFSLDKPISDKEAMQKDSYHFSVTNISDEPKNFLFRIELDQAIMEIDGCSLNTIPTEYIRYRLNNQQPENLGSLDGNNYIIYQSLTKLNPGSSEIHHLRLWIDENSPKDISSMHFHATLIVEEVNDKEYKDYKQGQTVTLAGTEYKVLEDSNSKNSVVKLLSNHNLTEQGLLDTTCNPCSTMSFDKSAKALSLFRKNLKLRLIDDEKERIIRIRQIRKSEIEANLNLVNSNIWTNTFSKESIKNIYVLSAAAKKTDIAPSTANTFGVRPVVIIDKDTIIDNYIFSNQ